MKYNKRKKSFKFKRKIGNAEETPVYLEMNEKKILNIKGEKEIKSKSFNKENIRKNLMLTILGYDNTLPPFVIFSGKPNGAKEKRLKAHPRVSSSDIYAVCQEKSWMDSATMIIYLKKILFNPSIYKQTKDTLFIRDRTWSHF